MDPTDQRRHSRKSFVAPVALASKGDAGVLLQAQSRDLSLGGMFVETDTPLALGGFGGEVVVKFRVPSYDKDIVVPAIVRWIKPDGMGLQFGNLGARETHAITEMLRG